MPGTTGAKGATGTAGPTGLRRQGPTGAKGDRRQRGATPSAEERDKEGVTGAKGRDGLRGPTGTKRANGREGPTGMAKRGERVRRTGAKGPETGARRHQSSAAGTHRRRHARCQCVHGHVRAEARTRERGPGSAADAVAGTLQELLRSTRRRPGRQDLDLPTPQCLPAPPQRLPARSRPPAEPHARIDARFRRVCGGRPHLDRDHPYRGSRATGTRWTAFQ